MINRPTGPIAGIDLTSVIVTGTPLVAITNTPLTARPDALKQLKAGVLGPFENLASFDANLKDLVARLRASNGVWTADIKTLGIRCRDEASLLSIRLSSPLPTPDRTMEAAAVRLRNYAVELGARP